MIKVNINTLIIIKPILQELANIKMPAKQSFKILHILKAADAEYAFIEKVQQKMILDYGKKDSNGDPILNLENHSYIIAEEHYATFEKEMSELLATEIELDCGKIDIELLDNINLSPNQLLAIEPFIELDKK